MTARDDARRYARLLRQVVELSGVSEREVERRLELSGGTLSRIFSGRIELKLSHLLAILAVLEMKPERFFQLAAVVFESGSGESFGRQVLDILARLTAEARPVPAEPEPAAVPELADHELVSAAVRLDDAELDRRIEAALDRLGIKDAGATPPAKAPPRRQAAGARRRPAKSRTGRAAAGQTPPRRPAPAKPSGGRSGSQAR